MAFCGKCGTQLNDGAKFCPKCGSKVGDNAPQPQQQFSPTQQHFIEQEKEEKLKTWQKILCFIISPIGLISSIILFIRKKTSMAKSALLWSLAGIVIGMVLTYLMETYSNSLLETAAKNIMIEEFKKEGTNLIINDITLVHKQGNEYDGMAECNVDGQDVQYGLKVLSDGANVQVQWELSSVGGDEESSVGGDEESSDEDTEEPSLGNDEVAEVGYNEGYQMGFSLAELGTSTEPTGANVAFARIYDSPNSPKGKALFNIFRQNYDRGFREGLRAGQ